MTEATKARVYNQDGVQLFHADALDWLSTLSPGAARCCVTSPPYFGSYPPYFGILLSVKNDGRFKKGERHSLATEFKKGEYLAIAARRLGGPHLFCDEEAA